MQNNVAENKLINIGKKYRHKIWVAHEQRFYHRNDIAPQKPPKLSTTHLNTG